MLLFQLTNTGAIKGADLICGQVYVTKDGRMLLYLGHNMQGAYLFYYIGPIALRECTFEPGVPEQGRWLTPINEEYLMPYYRMMLTDAMAGAPNRKCLITLSNVPNIVGSTFYGYEPGSLQGFFHKSGESWATLAASIADTWYGQRKPGSNNVSNEYAPVKASELVPGKIYVGGQVSDVGTRHEGYRETYLHLGKDHGMYAWLFIGWLDEVKEEAEGIKGLIKRYAKSNGIVDKTKALKKVYKPVYYREAANFQMGKIYMSGLVEHYGLL